MHWDSVPMLLLLFVSLAMVFSLAERLDPERTHRSYWSRERRVDWAWWPFSTFVTGNLVRVVVLGVVGVAVIVSGYQGTPEALLAWFAARPAWGLGHLPFAAQFIAAIALGDLLNYWNHRLRHTRWLWRFHAIHHSPQTLDWLSSVRMHPVDDLIDNVSVGLLLVLAGVRLDVWLAMGPFLLFQNFWIHANLPWRLGILRFVIATPAFHRRHHADDVDARPCNCAGVLPLWDLVFGTFSMPTDPVPHFGPGATPVPATLVAQLVFPFRSQRESSR